VTIVISGRDLSLDELIRVARGRESVEIDAAAFDRMAASRTVVERAMADGIAAYGLTTGVGVLKRVSITGPDADAYARRMIRHHVVGQGPVAPSDVARATLLLQLNAFASGTTGVRPVIAERIASALNDGDAPPVRILGSVGQADLAPLAELSNALFGDVELAAGEGLALVTGNAFATAWAALAISDAGRLLDVLDVSAALSLEGLAANLSTLHPAVERVRPHRGLSTSLANIRKLLHGSAGWSTANARNLQDPLSFRNAAHVNGAARDALAHAQAIVGVELNASQGNPIVDVDAGEVVSVANFEIAALAAALDYLRIGLATPIGVAAERVVKLLETAWSGLPTGLSASEDPTDAGLEYLGIAVQALAAEARLLAAPVSLELTSTAHAEGIEDRTTMAPLAARRTAEIVALGQRVVAIELVVAGQAVDLRGRAPLGVGSERSLRALREVIPFVGPDAFVPDVERVVRRIEAGGFDTLLGEVDTAAAATVNPGPQSGGRDIPAGPAS
jgi:histidine ammonia-lyase